MWLYVPAKEVKAFLKRFIQAASLPQVYSTEPWF